MRDFSFDICHGRPKIRVHYIIYTMMIENNDIEGVRTSSCGPPPDEDDDDDYTEEMFVQPHFTIGHQFVEWGGPTRGGRLSEPTRFGDWERKGRCTDF